MIGWRKLALVGWLSVLIIMLYLHFMGKYIQFQRMDLGMIFLN